MKILIYLLSNDFDYSRLITLGVSGPSVPQGFGWPSDHLSNIGLYPDCVLLIDIRISEREMEALENRIARSGQIFGFFVIDPYREAALRKPYLRFLFRVAARENVRFISRYQPSEIALDLMRAAGAARFCVMPYPYLSGRETNAPFEGRKHRIIASGAVNRGMYPLRYKFHKKAARIPLRFFADILPHPGYPDVGQNPTHAIVKEAYIKLLASYKFMFLSPSRCDLEFAKYAECAYAGCAPMGRAAGSMTQAMKEAFLDVDFKRVNISAITHLLKHSDAELRERAAQYRRAFQKDRDPAVLNQNLIDFFGVHAT